MPKVVSLVEVLDAVYRRGYLDECKEYPLQYSTFRKIMIGRQVVVTERTIRSKFEQIVYSGYAKPHPTNRNLIILDMVGVRNELRHEKKITGEYETDKIGADTHTHTKTAAAKLPGKGESL